MKVMFFDCETNGLPHASDITEVGYVVYDNTDGKWTEEEEFNALVWDESYPPQPQVIVELTGITDDDLKREGQSPLSIVEKIHQRIATVDVVVAHNAPFDKGIFLDKVKKFKLEEKHGANPDKWLCSLRDVPYADKYKCKKLSHLAYDHGILVHPDTLHRALDDVKLLARLITEKYDLQNIMQYAKSPWVYLRAVVPGPWTDNGAGKDWAKANGYGWEAARGDEEKKFPKCWVKRVKAFEVEKQQKEAPTQYAIVVLQG